jgi:flagellar motor component MotA
MTTTPSTDPATTAANLATDIETLASDAASAATVITKASAWTAIIGICTALPGIVQLMLIFWKWADTISGGNPGTLIANATGAFGQLAQAKTEADRQAATQNISNLFGKLP